MNNYIKSIVEFDIEKVSKDYGKFLETEQPEIVLNNIILSYSENIGRISDGLPEDLPDSELLDILKDYSSRMLKLWDLLQKRYKDLYFEFTLDNPFESELDKTDQQLARLLFP